MIYYNSNTINDWNYGDDNIIKVYRHNAICYYKITGGGDTPTAQTPCFAVVDDISQYSETEFEDVFNKADGKWYKLNNLNNYEEYGVYGSGRTITTYDGKLTIDDGYEYQYSGNSWVNVGEVSGSSASLPNVPFVLNYNAKNYNASTHSIPKTTGQLNDMDAVITGYTSQIIDHSADGYIQLTGNTSTAIRAQVGTTNFSRSASNPNLTIICKAYTPGSSTEGNIISNRNESYNWMYRHKSSTLRFHGNSEQGQIAVSNTQPNTCSVRVDSNRLLTYNNWTQNTSSTYSNFSYGSNSNGGALFSGYYSTNGEYWKGVFYWIYMSLYTLTDEQVQQVIAYNEDSGGQVEYPVYYSEKADPPNNVSFSSMTEAEEYECPYVGMNAIIDGERYVFSGDSISGYEWVYNPSGLPSGYTEVEYVENQSQAFINTGFKPNQDTRIVCKMQTVTSTSGGRFIGAGGYDKANAMQFDYEQGATGTLHISWGASAGWTIYSSCVGDYNIHVYDWDKNYFYRDRGEANEFSANTSYSSFQCTDNLGIFTRFQNGSGGGSTECLKGNLYYCKIYDNGVLVRDFVPCTRDSDSVAGVYDIVNDVFYSSANSYQLVAGPTV